MTILDTVIQLSAILQPFTQPRTVYVPTWASAGPTQPAIGNGTLSGRYVNLGKIGFLQITVKCGTTTVTGGADYQFGLPNGWTSAANPVGSVVVGAAIMFDTSTNTYWTGGVIMPPSSTHLSLVTSGSTNLVGAATPIGDFSNGDTLTLESCFELT